jgi:4-hydroxysphinganine ceramide fatty acyl 2-hydroxylase
MPKNYVSNKDETVRMFENDFLEALSKVHPSVPVIIYLPIILYLLYLAVVNPSLTTLAIIMLMFFGIVIWTLTEYTLHRFIFHYEPKTKFGERIHFMFHGVHHDYPSDSRRLVMPPSISIPLALLFYVLFYYLLGSTYIQPFFVGFLTGYLLYDMTHYAVHHFNMHNKFWLAIKNHHMRHHYLNSRKGFGVSSPMWDDIMGTNFDDFKKKE